MVRGSCCMSNVGGGKQQSGRECSKVITLTSLNTVQTHVLTGELCILSGERTE